MIRIKPDRGESVLQKHTLNLFRGDFAELSDIYHPNDASLVIRLLLRKHIKDIREGTEQKVEVRLD